MSLQAKPQFQSFTHADPIKMHKTKTAISNFQTSLP